MAGNWQRHSMVRISIAKHRETGRLRVTLRGGRSNIRVSGETGDHPALVMFTIMRLWLLGAKRVAALVDDTPRIVEATSTHQGTAWSVDNAVRGEVWIDRDDGNGAVRIK